MLEDVGGKLYRVRGSFGSNIYLIAGDGLAMVDAGFAMDLPVLYLALRELGAAPRDIDLVVATHYHGDHIGTISGLKKRHGTCSAIHVEDGPYVSGELPQDTCEAALPQLVFYTVFWPLFRYRHFQADRLLEDGDVLDIMGGLQVLHAPGHSKGSVCLYHPGRGILFSGDLVRNEGGILEGPPPHFTPDEASTRISLRRIAEIDFETLLPGHGDVIARGAGNLLRSRVEEGVIWPICDGRVARDRAGRTPPGIV